MPEPRHPPYPPGGAISIPRQLIRWLDVNSQNGQLDRIRYYVVLPTFNIQGLTYQGSSVIVGEFHYEAPNNFSFDARFITWPTNPDHSLAISYVNADNSVVRYFLYRSATDNLLFDPVRYVGQLIKKNFRLEVWSSSLATATGSGLNIYTSLKGNYDYRFQLDAPLVGSDGLCQGQNVNGTGGSSIAITADSTSWTADSTTPTADATVTSGGGLVFNLPLVWGTCCNPTLNT